MTWYAYVFPCVWEDHCKVGFSRDPLARIVQLHRRWFETFDLQRGFLVEAEREREARDLELALRRPFAAHAAPQPLTIRRNAGGHTEWLRGALEGLCAERDALSARGHRVHAPLADWLRHALAARCDLLHDWAAAQLSPDELDGRVAYSPTQRDARDTLDAHVALGIDVEPLLPARVVAWYRTCVPRSPCLREGPS